MNCAMQTSRSRTCPRKSPAKCETCPVCVAIARGLRWAALDRDQPLSGSLVEMVSAAGGERTCRRLLPMELCDKRMCPSRIGADRSYAHHVVMTERYKMSSCRYPAVHGAASVLYRRCLADCRLRLVYRKFLQSKKQRAAKASWTDTNCQLDRLRAMNALVVAHSDSFSTLICRGYRNSRAVNCRNVALDVACGRLTDTRLDDRQLARGWSTRSVDVADDHAACHASACRPADGGRSRAAEPKAPTTEPGGE